MYLMYVDESGDCGMPNEGSPTKIFCLSGLVIHEMRWKDTLADLGRFRQWLFRRYKVNVEDELHAADMINKPSTLAPSLRCLKKHERLAILRHFAHAIARLTDASIINVVVNKMSGKVPNKDEVYRWAWYSLFQRFENTIRYQNFPGPKNADDRGLVFPDNTDGQKLKRFLNRMRWRNELTVRQKSGSFHLKDDPIRTLIEDPIMRDSRESYFIQAADCVAYLLKQNLEPSGYMRKHGGKFYFNRLDPVLCKRASEKDPAGKGVVRL